MLRAGSEEQNPTLRNLESPRPAEHFENGPSIASPGMLGATILKTRSQGIDA